METLHFILIYCKRWDDWYLRFLFPTLLASKGDHTSRWSLFSVSFNKFSLQLSWVGACAKSPGWTMERCGKETQSCQAVPNRHCLLHTHLQSSLEACRLKLCLPLTLSCVGKGRPLSSRMRDFPLFINTEALSYIHSFHQPWIVSSPGRSKLNISDEKAA